MTLVISREDLHGPLALSLGDAIDIVERLYAGGDESVRIGQAPVRMKVPSGSLRFVAGAMLDAGIMGGRIGGGSGLNGGPSRRSGGGMGPTALLRVDTGETVAFVPSMSILRTGATVGAATRRLSPATSRIAALLGTGRNAMSCLLGMAAVRELDEIRVYSRNEARREEFAARAAGQSPVPVRAVARPEEALDGADVVTCLTNSSRPVYDPAVLAEHATLNAFGSVAEVPDETYLNAAAVYVGSKRQEQQTELYESFYPGAPRHTIVELAREGRLDWEAGVQDLGVAMQAGWRRPDGRVVFKDSRGGFGDVALCLAVYEQAMARGVGTEIEF